MILSKPKRSTLFSLSIFLILAYGIGIWTALALPSSPAYWKLIPILCLVTAVAVNLKVLWGYHTIQVKGEQWKVKNLIRADKSFTSSEIEWWKETEIKTAGGPFRELHIHTKNGVDLKISLQEHTEYQKIIKQVRRKYPKKQIERVLKN